MNENINSENQSGNSQDNRQDTIIIVNGRERKADGKELTFNQVIELAFGQVDQNPNICYTITYKRGPGQNPEGSMVEGESVKVNKGMIFNVTRTDKS